jgi:hypothetical protein
MTLNGFPNNLPFSLAAAGFTPEVNKKIVPTSNKN